MILGFYKKISSGICFVIVVARHTGLGSSAIQQAAWPMLVCIAKTNNRAFIKRPRCRLIVIVFITFIERLNYEKIKV